MLKAVSCELTPEECMKQPRWLIMSRSAAWLLGIMASVTIVSTMLFALWLGAAVPRLQERLGKTEAKLDYLNQLAVDRDSGLEDKIAALKVEIDKLKHNDGLLADKLLTLEREMRRRRR